MPLTIKQIHTLRKFVRELERIRGRHTELVSVYIPAGYDMNKIINHLQQEQGTAANIKDKTTQKHVIDALERMIRHLRLFKSTPPNGLAVFSGNASDQEGKVDMKVWSIEPPEPINTRIYRCDQTFKLDILKQMMDIKETYGLIVVDRREGTIGLLKGTNITELHTLTSGVPGKTRAGGQCLAKDTSVHLTDGQYVMIEDLQEGDEVLSYDFESDSLIATKVLKKWNTVKDKVYRIKLNGGDVIEASEDHLLFTADRAEKNAGELREGDFLLGFAGNPVEIESIKVIEGAVEMVDIEVENKNFIAENLVVHNSAQRFERLREGAAKEFYRRIADVANKEFLGMKNLKGILVGGPGPTKNEFLEKGFLNEQLKRKVISVQDLSYTGEFGLRELVEKSSEVIAKESIIEEKKVMNQFFEMLAKEPDKVTYGLEQVKKALDYGAVSKLLVSEDLDEKEIENLEEKCEESGADFQLISTDTTEGAQLRDLGKVAAILRYALAT